MLSFKIKKITVLLLLLVTTTLLRGGVYSLQDYLALMPSLDAKTEEIFNQYTTQERYAQLIMQAVGPLGKPNEYILDAIKKKQIGGVLFLKGDKAGFLNLNDKIKAFGIGRPAFPMMITADAEPSLINRKIAGTPSLPKTNELNNKEINEKTCQIINKELLDIGINWNFAPDCDLNINKAIIGNRSYGNTTEIVAKRALEFIHQTQNSNIIATAKHFPGHGNVIGDSHKGLVYINGALKELPIYESLIEQGVLSIMVGHIAIKNNEEYNTAGLPSTCSKNIVTTLLRNKLNFRGLIITDAMNMGAILSVSKTPSLKALEAGVDIVLMPNGEQALIDLITQKCVTNLAFKNQIEASVKRVIRMKICLGLYDE